MLKLEYSPLALGDLQNIHDYIIINWGERAAKKILKKITTDIRILEENPLSGVDLAKQIEVPTDYRYLFTKNNYVFYHVEVDRVRVVRILNEQQDYMMQLFGINFELENED